MRWHPCRHLAAPDQVSWHGPDKALTTLAGCVSGDIMATVPAVGACSGAPASWLSP